MLEQYRELKNSIYEVSKWAGRTAKVLSASGSPAPETYLSATRAIRALQETWSLHLKIERVLFPRMLRRNLLSAEFLERITVSNQSIDAQLEGILSAPWPRSPQAGLQSLRTGVRRILIQLRAQIEVEGALILPAILNMDRMDHSEPAVVRAKSHTSELVTT